MGRSRVPVARVRQCVVVWILTLAVLTFAAPARVPSATPTATASDDLLARAAAYVRRFEQSMSTVVVEERYVQIIKTWTLPPKEPDTTHLEWFDDLSAVRPDVIVAQRRQIKSDVLLVHVADRGWTAFRDTIEVNSRHQGGREDRLRSLFVEQSDDSRRQLRRIHEKSAEFNLGGFYREINLPTTALLVAHPAHQRRFAFTVRDLARRGETTCRLVSFTETARPTLVRSVQGDDVPLRGHLCLDDTGAVWNSRLDLDGRYTMRGLIDVTYGRHERTDVLVPERMWEWYVLPEPDERGLPVFVEAMATYSNLRRFTVRTTEKVRE